MLDLCQMLISKNKKTTVLVVNPLAVFRIPAQHSVSLPVPVPSFKTVSVLMSPSVIAKAG